MEGAYEAILGPYNTRNSSDRAPRLRHVRRTGVSADGESERRDDLLMLSDAARYVTLSET